MKNLINFFLIIFMTGLISCRSSKDLIYLNDAANYETIKDLSKAYILKTGDILYVSIKSISPEVNTLFNPESGMEATSNSGLGYQKYTTPSGAYLYGFELDTNGNITLPMFGKVNVIGVTVNQAETIVQKKADEVLKDAIVKVKLLNFKVTVAGEVRNPGVYYNYNNSINVLEVLALANGNTDFATIKKVMIVRAVPEGKKNVYARFKFKKSLFVGRILSSTR